MVKIDHIGIAVKNLELAREVFSTILNKEPSKNQMTESENANTLFFEAGDSGIQLLEATDINSPIRKFIEKRGEGIHHIAIQVEDLEQAISEYRQKGFSIHAPPVLSEGNKMVACMNSRETYGVLIQLCQYIH